MSDFPVSDDDIRALKVKILRALGDVANPRAAIGDVAHNHKLTIEDVKSLVVEHGWPDGDTMRREAIVLDGRIPARPARPGPPGISAIEQALARAEKSSKARTRNLAVKVRAGLTELAKALAEESADAQRAAAEAEKKAQLKADVERLERELQAKKAELRGRPAESASTTKKPAADSPSKAIRAWAKSKGLDCPAMGRIPSHILTQYQAEGASQ